MTYWSFDNSTFVILTGLIAVLITLYFCFNQWKRSTQKRKTIFTLELLRLIIVIMLAFTLLRPELVTQITKDTNPEVVILYDKSGSMKSKDVLDEKGIISRNAWVQKQFSRKFAKSLDKKFTISIDSFSGTPSKNKIDGTDLNYALSKKLSSYKNLRAVILMSDGDWNMGGNPLQAASALRHRKAPIYSIAVGSNKYIPDLKLQEIKFPGFCLVNEKIFIPFQVQSRLERDVSTKIQILSPQGTVAEKVITIPANSLYKDSLMWEPKVTGRRQVTISLPVEKEELITENNEKDFNIDVRVEKLKVLVIDSVPRWEYRYLRNALFRDPGVDVKTLLFHPGMKIGGGQNYLKKFPTGKNELSKYDVIFLGDIGISKDELTNKQVKMLKGVVRNQGSGLVFLPGRRGRQHSFISSPLDELLPVELDQTNPKGISSPVDTKIVLSEYGSNHLLTMLAATPEQNSLVWRNLPGFYWNAAIKKARPGSNILAVHSALRGDNGRMPLLVTKHFGNGNVLFMGTDSAWRWRKGVEDKYHYRFWGQVVRWMAHKRHLAHNKKVRLFYTPETPSINDKVFIHATINDNAGYPIEGESVTVTLTHKERQNSQLFKLFPMKGGWGVYHGSCTLGVSGKYNLNVKCKNSGINFNTELNVLWEKIEKVGNPARWDVLKELSRISRGKFNKSSNLNKVIREINSLPKAIIIEKRILIWQKWWWGVAILSLLGIYWVTRKLIGLI